MKTMSMPQHLMQTARFLQGALDKNGKYMTLYVRQG
jgi:hypothetical protein